MLKSKQNQFSELFLFFSIVFVVCLLLSNILATKLLRIGNYSVTAGVNEGIVRAVENIEAQKDLLKKINYDNRIRNTKLLLSNYLNFKKHIKTAVYTEEQLSTEETSDILDR